MLGKVKEFFVRLFNKAIRLFRDFIRKAFTVSSQIVIGELKDFALEVVKELDAKRLSNEKKRQEAFERIKEEALRRGLKVRDSLIYTLIELAVQCLKNKLEGKGK